MRPEFFKTDSLPPQVLEDTTSVYLVGYNDERANLLHQNHSGELKLYLHSVTIIPKHSRSKEISKTKRRERELKAFLDVSNK